MIAAILAHQIADPAPKPCTNTTGCSAVESVEANLEIIWVFLDFKKTIYLNSSVLSGNSFSVSDYFWALSTQHTGSHVRNVSDLVLFRHYYHSLSNSNSNSRYSKNFLNCPEENSHVPVSCPSGAVDVEGAVGASVGSSVTV